MEIIAEGKTSGKVPTLFTVSQFSEKHSFISEGGLRFQIFDAKDNGLEKAGAVVRIGRRVLINEEKYFAWIDFKQNGNVGQKL